MAVIRSVQTNLTIHQVRVRFDGRVLIIFSFTRPGLYQNIRFSTTAHEPGKPYRFVMTPMFGDPQHSQSPIYAQMPGQLFSYLWDAPADGFPNICVIGWRFDIAYVDLLCCEEMEERDPLPDEEDDPPPPVPPVPPEDTPDPTTPPEDVPDPGTPHQPPDDPNFPTEDIPGTVPDDGLPENFTPGDDILPDTRFDPFNPNDPLGHPRTEEEEDPLVVPPWGPGFTVDDTGIIYNERGEVVYVPPGVHDDGTFNYDHHVDTSAPPEPPPGEVFVDPENPDHNDGTRKFQTSALMTQPIEGPALLPATEYSWLFSIPVEDPRLSLSAFMPSPELRIGESVPVYYGMNLLEGEMSNVSVAVIVRDVENNFWFVQAPEPVLARHSSYDYLGGGLLRQGKQVGMPVCIYYSQLPVGPLQALVVLLSGNMVPIATALTNGVVMPPNAPPPTPGPQPVEELSEIVRSVAGFDAGILPTFEGSVNAVGDADLFLVDIERDNGFVLKISSDAWGSGFEPAVDIYDIDNLSTPALTLSTPFAIGGTEIAPTSHSIGWRNRFEFLAPGRYAIAVRHKTPHWSRRWNWKLFTNAAVPETLEAFTTDGTNLTGSFFCAYARQSVKLINDRTSEVIFVKTDAYGHCVDVQAKARPFGTFLPAISNDVLELIRPGPHANYLRDGDIFAKGTVE